MWKGESKFGFLIQNCVRVQIFTCITYPQADLQPFLKLRFRVQNYPGASKNQPRPIIFAIKMVLKFYKYTSYRSEIWNFHENVLTRVLSNVI